MYGSCRGDKIAEAMERIEEKRLGESRCVEQAIVFDEGENVHCHFGAVAEIKPTGFGSRQLLVCHCPEPKSNP